MYKFFLLISFIACLASCKSGKSLITELDDPTTYLFEKIEKASVEYDWYSAKAKVRIESPEQSGSGRMNIRMKKDSIIWFNFKKVSIEGARGVISPDDFTIIYRTQKKYEKGSLGALLDHFGLPMSFGEMQSYLAGNIILPQQSSLGYKKTKKHHILMGTNGSYYLTYLFDNELNLQRYIIADGQSRKLAISLDKFDEELGIYKNRKLTYRDKQNKSGTLEMDLSNIEINEPKKMPFSIPDHYTQY